MLGDLGSEMEHGVQAATPQQKLLQRTVFKVSCTMTECFLYGHAQLRANSAQDLFAMVVRIR